VQGILSQNNETKGQQKQLTTTNNNPLTFQHKKKRVAVRWLCCAIPMPLVSAFAALPAPVVEISTGFPDSDAQEKKHRKNSDLPKFGKSNPKHLYKIVEI